MLQERRYSLSELQNYLAESSDFKPKYGKNVANGDNSEGDKAAKELQKKAEETQPKAKEHNNVDLTNNGDFNKSTIDLRFMEEPSKVWSERIESQIAGFAGKKEQETHKDDEYGNGDFDGNERFLKAAKERAEKFNDDRNKEANSGLKSRELAKKGLGSDKKTAFDGKGEDKNVVRGDDDKDNKNKEIENKASEKPLKENRMKILNFKHTQFLSEAQVLKRVPEEYKTDGNKFIMKDATGTEYLIECRVDSTFGNKSIKVVNRFNKAELTEDFNKMRSLWNYTNLNEGTERINENDEVEKMLNIMRGLKK